VGCIVITVNHSKTVLAKYSILSHTIPSFATGFQDIRPLSHGPCHATRDTMDCIQVYKWFTPGGSIT
jgi:hypothetical protein